MDHLSSHLRQAASRYDYLRGQRHQLSALFPVCSGRPHRGLSSQALLPVASRLNTVPRAKARGAVMGSNAAAFVFEMLS